MIDGRRILGIIPARGGSKGLPGKNLCELAGTSLLGWTARAALGSKYIDRVVLSSDDDSIIEAGLELGLEAPFKRPASIAGDESTAVEVVEHTLDELDEGYDLVVLLQPTSPLRTQADIDGSIERLHGSGASSCVTVQGVDKPPEWMFRLDSEHRMSPVMPRFDQARRQEQPPAFALNGAVYVTTVDSFRRRRSFVGDDCVAYVMPRERSVDIDDETDLKLAEVFAAAGKPR